MEEQFLTPSDGPMEEDRHREILEEHARRPRNKREMPDADLSGKCRSEVTGNLSAVFLKLGENGTVTEASFTGQGSALSLASGSLLATHATGCSREELEKLKERVERVVRESAEEELPGELEVYRTARRFPERHDCILLAWRALSAALAK